ncbi:hypothetical protein [Sphaerisporangium rhizosphaerae]|uniref:Uncharacterized protein n=1 Tax=Sphaerisporangium rhizosphaerae TaxID=2269375 RepID=A0ABW2PFL2_9ACTN
MEVVVMGGRPQAGALERLAEAITRVRISGGPTIRRAWVESYEDSEGEPALKGFLVLDPPDEDGWSAEFTHALRRRVNTLAVERQIDEHVYVALFTQEEFEAREGDDEQPEDDSPGALHGDR